MRWRCSWQAPACASATGPQSHQHHIVQSSPAQGVLLPAEGDGGEEHLQEGGVHGGHRPWGGPAVSPQQPRAGPPAGGQADRHPGGRGSPAFPRGAQDPHRAQRPTHLHGCCGGAGRGQVRGCCRCKQLVAWKNCRLTHAAVRTVRKARMTVDGAWQASGQNAGHSMAEAACLEWRFTYWWGHLSSTEGY
jgi:hypothetical protein